MEIHPILVEVVLYIDYDFLVLTGSTFEEVVLFVARRRQSLLNVKLRLGVLVGSYCSLLRTKSNYYYS